MKLKEYKGYNYVIMAVDYFTKYVKMGCLKQKCAKEVTKWIFDNIFCQYRVCDVHITDNGTEFVNHIFMTEQVVHIALLCPIILM